MSLPNVDSLLEPVSPENPIGDTSEYNAEVADLERTALGKPERQAGNTILPAEPPEWAAVERKAVDVLARRKDLRVAALLTQALLERQGFEGLRCGLEVLRRLLETYWEGINPRLDPEDDNDPAIRVNIVAGLCDPAVLRAVRGAPLLRSSAFGFINLRQVSMALGHTPAAPDTPAMDPTTLEAAAKDAGAEAVAAMAKTLREALEQLTGIGAVFEQRCSAGQGPDLSPLHQLVYQASKAIHAYVGQPGADDAAAIDESSDADAASGASAGGGAAGARPAARPLGEIASRDDVVRAIDRICAYYTRHEPASPVPLLLARCKRLATMSFLDIVRDMAPDALSQVEIITGKPEEKSG